MSRRMMTGIAAIVALGVLLGRVAPSAADQRQNGDAAFSPAQLAERTIHRRAVEAVIWGMPAVNYELMLQEMLTKTPGQVGQVIYWGRPLDARNQTLTPNPDALYFMAFYDTQAGPVVLDLPPGDADGSFNGNIVTVANAAGRRRAAGRGQGKRRQVPRAAARVQTAGARRVHRTPLRHVWRLHAVAFQPQEP